MTARDYVFVENLQIETVIGIYEWEQNTRQNVRIDLQLACDASAAAKTDEIDQALNYHAVCNRLEDFVGKTRHKLVETLADRIAELILSEFGVSWLKVSVSKPGAVPSADNVGVVIERSSD